MRTYPTTSLEAILDLIPLYTHVQTQAKRAFLRMANIEAKGFLKRREIDILTKQYPEIAMPRDTMHAKFNFTKSFKTDNQVNR